MYIWIFLATIMIALSFFNLSPRQDKDNALSEIKAASVVNRFKAEHNAAARTMECEVALKMNTQSWRQDYNFSAIELTDDILNNIGYTSWADNLPIGYQVNDAQKVKHAIYCLSNRIDKSDNAFIDCNNSEFIYVVSYIKIPENWLTKNNAEGQMPTPIPAFNNLLAKGTSLKNPYGWTSCTLGEEDALSCVMSGAGAKNVIYDTETGTSMFVVLPPESVAWQNDAFKADCTTEPCLFSYQLMKTHDVNDHCKVMVDRYNRGS